MDPAVTCLDSEAAEVYLHAHARHARRRRVRGNGTVGWAGPDTGRGGIGPRAGDAAGAIPGRAHEKQVEWRHWATHLVRSPGPAGAGLPLPVRAAGPAMPAGRSG